MGDTELELLDHMLEEEDRAVRNARAEQEYDYQQNLDTQEAEQNGQWWRRWPTAEHRRRQPRPDVTPMHKHGTGPRLYVQEAADKQRRRWKRWCVRVA